MVGCKILSNPYFFWDVVQLNIGKIFSSEVAMCAGRVGKWTKNDASDWTPLFAPNVLPGSKSSWIRQNGIKILFPNIFFLFFHALPWMIFDISEQLPDSSLSIFELHAASIPGSSKKFLKMNEILMVDFFAASLSCLCWTISATASSTMNCIGSL